MINTFEFLINTGVQSLEMIADAEKKATVCAELAKAIAMSGVLRAAEVEEDSTEEEQPKTTKGKKSSTKKNSKKESLKTENQKEETVTPIEEEQVVEAPAVPVEEEPVAEAPQAPVEAAEEVPAPAPTAEVEIVDEWTEEMLTLKAEQLGILNSYVEAWGEEYVYNDCLGCFSENAFVGAENVRPSNIDGFVVYLNQLAQQFAQQ